DVWKAFLAEHHTGHDYMCRVKVPGGMPLLDRIAIRDYGGFFPIRVFLVLPRPLCWREPDAPGDRGPTAVPHAIQWDQDKRHLIPEVIGVHLQSGQTSLGANWRGRTTPRFGPGPVPPSDGSEASAMAAYDSHRSYMG